MNRFKCAAITMVLVSVSAGACTDSSAPLSPAATGGNPSGGTADKTAPTVSVAAPAGGATVSGDVTVTANASDNIGIAGVQFKLDGANVGAEDTATPYSMSWDTRAASNGTHTLTAVARDGGGNVTTSAGVAVTVSNATAAPADTAPPTASITAPQAGASVSGSITVSANAGDNVGVVGVQFKLDGANLGGEDTGPPYAVSWNTASVGNGAHTLSAVARDAAGNTATAPSMTVNVSNTTPAPAPTPAPSPAPAPALPPPLSGGGAWPNEPAGFRTINDQSWDSLTGNGWNFLARTPGNQDAIIADGTAPFSPSNVLQIDFTTNMSRDSEPSVHWMGLSQAREIYTGWWMKLSSNWTPSPAGGGKIAFLWAPDGQGQVYSNVGGSSAPHRININTEWAPYGQNFWEPNVSMTPIDYGQWYRIEWYVRWESSPGAGDGIMRWWVNGTLNGDYRNVRFPACCFQQFEYAPTLQNPPPATQYMWIDHTHVSTP